MLRVRLFSVRGLAAWILLLLTASLVSGQDTPQFRYAIPKFTTASGAELAITNLSAQEVEAKLRLVSGAATVFSGSMTLAPGSQTRLNSTFFKAVGDAVIVTSSTPLSVVGTIPVGSGFDNVDAVTEQAVSFVSVFPGAADRTDVVMFNADSIPVRAYIVGFASDGSSTGVVQAIVPASGSTTLHVAAVFPQFPRTDTAHLVIRATSNALSPERHLFVQARLVDHADSAALSGASVSSAQQNPVLPLFMQGGGFVTTIEAINVSDRPASGAVLALGSDGHIVSVGSSFQLPPNGSIRGTADTLLNTGSDAVSGMLAFASDVPLVVTEGISNASKGGSLLTTAAAADTKFTFSHRDANSQFFTSITLANLSVNAAHVKLTNIFDDGTMLGQTSLTVDPFTSVTRTVAELFAGAVEEGFVYISSDVPVFATAVEGTMDNALLATIPSMHSQPDYTPPKTNRFRIGGSLRLGSGTVAGVTVQLSGSANSSTVSDKFGAYVFDGLLPGQYIVAPSSSAYTFAPVAQTVTIEADDSVQVDFNAALGRPVISSVQPSGIRSGSPDTVITVNGGPFDDGSEIVLEGVPLPTILTTSIPPALQAVIPASSLIVPRQAFLFVRRNTPDGSLSSASVTLSIGTAAPVLSSLGNVPQPLLAGNPGFSMTVAGSGFLSGVTALINGTPRTTTLETASTLRVTVPAEDLARPAILTVTAVNPGPTTGPSNPLNLVVTTPPPQLSSISPAATDVRLAADAAPLAIEVRGSNFVPGAKILLNGVEIETVFVSAASLTGMIPASALQVGGTFQVSVRNPEPSQGISGTLSLLVNNVAPILTSIEASSLTFDPNRLTPVSITLHGENFSPNSVFELIPPCAAIYAANRISSQTAVLTVSLQCAGSYQTRVRTPQPGGGVSQTLVFSVN